MIECVRRTSRNVKHWQNGEMCLRWTAAGMLEAEQQFRRIVGYQELAKLATAVEREVTLPQAQHRFDRRGSYRRTSVVTNPGPPPKFHAVRDILVQRPRNSFAFWQRLDAPESCRRNDRYLQYLLLQRPASSTPSHSPEHQRTSGTLH